jgi:hypothetical protein
VADLDVQLQACEDEEQALRDRYLGAPSEKLSRQLGDARAAKKEVKQAIRIMKSELT